MRQKLRYLLLPAMFWYLPDVNPTSLPRPLKTEINAMGRSKRSKKEEDADDDELDNYEREWLSQRANLNASLSNKRQKITNDVETKQGGDGNDVATNSPRASHANTSSRDGCAKGLSGLTEQDKVKRMRLKKQRQKERRRQKKAILATNQETKIKCMSVLEKSSGKEKSVIVDKKKKAYEKHPSQSFGTLNKGVRYLDLVIGEGPTVQHRKKVRVSYTLRAKSHNAGKILDSSHNFGFRLGKGEVIQGWDIGLGGMRVGGVRRLIVPPLAGYGNNKDVGAGRGGDLFFEVKLLHVAR